MEIQYIQTTEKHIPALMEMMREFCLYFDYEFDAIKKQNCILEFLSAKNLGHIWLIKQDKAYAGYIILTFGYSFEYHGRDAFIDEFYIRENFRNQGTGSKTLNFIFSITSQYQIKAVHLEVEKTNKKGQKLYLNHGFKGKERYLLSKSVGD